MMFYAGKIVKALVDLECKRFLKEIGLKRLCLQTGIWIKLNNSVLGSLGQLDSNLPTRLHTRVKHSYTHINTDRHASRHLDCRESLSHVALISFCRSCQ